MGDFFVNRMTKMGVNALNNMLELAAFNEDTGISHIAPMPAFTEDQDGNIDIIVYDIYGNILTYENGRDGRRGYATESAIRIKRLKEPKIIEDKETGEEREAKYIYPRGAESSPYYPRLILDLFRNKTETKTLYLTEGYFKSWVACDRGLPCIGLQSITCYKTKSGKMFPNVIDFIRDCKVRNVVMLYDGDCFDISEKALQKGKDLYLRPATFIGSITNIRELFKSIDVDIYFACIKSENFEGKPKGIDDLYISREEEKEQITADLLNLVQTSNYITRINVTTKLNKALSLFHCANADVFYSYHQAQIGIKEFCFKSKNYFWSEVKNKLEFAIDEGLKSYYRIGNDYYKIVLQPNANGTYTSTLTGRRDTLITRDFGKEAFEYIPKYDGFCNVPNNTEYKRIVNGFFNLYEPFTHEPKAGNCDKSLAFLRHIFGYERNEKGVEYYDIALDYITLLYEKPCQKLPIICLVSRENKTGKSTFCHWLQRIFDSNSATITSNDFDSNFNGHWISKLLVICEEFQLEKESATDKIKFLSTTNRASREQKGKDACEIDVFAKFILCSNNEDKFMRLNENDERYFVVKVPQIPADQLNSNLENELIEEIPYFLNYLINRPLKYPAAKDRMYFPKSDYRTKAFYKVVEANRPTADRLIREYIRTIFLELEYSIIYNDLPALYLGLSEIKNEILKNRYDEPYIKEILQNIPHEKFMKDGKRTTKRYELPYFNAASSGEGIDYKKFVGKPFVFYAKDFLSEEELEQIKISDKLPW